MLYWITWGRKWRVVHGDLLKAVTRGFDPPAQVTCVITVSGDGLVRSDQTPEPGWVEEGPNLPQRTSGMTVEEKLHYVRGSHLRGLLA